MQLTASDSRTDVSAPPSPAYRWEGGNPATSQANAADGMLMQAYTLSLSTFCR